jgi:exodeoxyribonuclease VII large subunit
MFELWSVSSLTRYIRGLFDMDYRLQDLWVEGEVSNLSRPASGHVYFTLKDSGAQMRCVMWRGQVSKLARLPRDGEAVEAHGNVSVYETGGQYQLYVDALRPSGAGRLYRQFVELKEKLETEGLFAEERKRPLPDWPRIIGVVTSPSGAALRDILNVIGRRFPLAEVILSPTAVQGEGAPAQIVAALEALEACTPDVILLARGGGSLEDLWAFNDERVARAVAATSVPVVCGVGHETDFTIADFVADRRAPTPSAAAELVTPDLRDVRDALGAQTGRLAQSLAAQVQTARWALSEQTAALRGLSPRGRLANARQRLDELVARIGAGAAHRLALRRERLAGLAGALAAMNLNATLARGYAVVTRAGTGDIVRSARQVAPGEALEVRLSDGTIGVTVNRS